MLSALLPSYTHIVQWLIDYRYLVVLPLAIIEGPLLAIICGIILKTGFLSLWPIFICLMIGDIISDTYWYYIGYHGGPRLTKRFAKYFSVTEVHLDAIKRHYQKHYFIILLLSKLTMGLGFAIAIVAAAGYARVPYKKYMIANIVGQPIWTTILLAVGYFLGSFFTSLKSGLDYLSFGAGIIIVLALLYGLARYIRGRLLEQYL